jgi:hypothetical protein
VFAVVGTLRRQTLVSGLRVYALNAPSFVCLRVPSSAIVQVVEHGAGEREDAMDARTWIFGAILVLLVVGYFALRPRGEAPTAAADSPAVTEQPAEPAPAN